MLTKLISMLEAVRLEADHAQLSILALTDKDGGRAGAAVIVTFELRDKTYETKLELNAYEMTVATEPQFEDAVERLCADALEQLTNAKGARITPEEAKQRLLEAYAQRPEALALNAIAAAAASAKEQ